MQFKRWLLQERTLFHGTIVDNEESIKQIGLVADDKPGAFVQHAYGGELPEGEMEGMIFMADKDRISAAVTAMVAHISNKLNKDFHDVTDTDVRNHGLFVVIKDVEPDEDYIRHKPEEEEGHYVDHPTTAEPGDYYAPEVGIDYTIRGPVLLKFLRRLGIWPISPYADISPETENKMRGRLVALSIRAHPNKSKQEIIYRVKQVPAEELGDYIDQYKD